MIKNDASGNINGIGYKPGQLIDLVRNPNWSAKTSWRPAHADEVLFKEGYQDPTVMTRTILSGSADVNGDSPPPPAELRSIMTPGPVLLARTGPGFARSNGTPGWERGRPLGETLPATGPGG